MRARLQARAHFYRVSVKATPSQKGSWETAARLHGLATAGAFLAWAGDMHLAGEINIGDTALDSPSDAERARQERMKREG